MIKALKKILKEHLPQNQFLQRMYLGFYYFGIWGMNYGTGGGLIVSGEKKALQLIKSRLKTDNPVLLDVGANSGDFALLLNETFPEAQIHCVEPLPLMCEIIDEKTRSLNNVSIHQLALGNEPGQLPLYSNAEETKLSSLVTYRGQKSSNDAIMVRVDTLDNFCSEQNIDQISLLKLDVEGYEMNALQGAKEKIEKGDIECIQFEFGGTMIDSKTYFRDFWNLLSDNYNIYRIVRNGLYPIKSYNVHLEVFHFSNFVAFLK